MIICGEIFAYWILLQRSPAFLADPACCHERKSRQKHESTKVFVSLGSTYSKLEDE
jgi:hypothetical protein